MAEGGWVVLGTAIGSLGSILATWLNLWMSRKGGPDYFDKKAMDVLKGILESGGGPWHDINHLANAVGLKTEETKQLLLLIGARGHESGSRGWALISKVGFQCPKDQPSE